MLDDDHETTAYGTRACSLGSYASNLLLSLCAVS